MRVLILCTGNSCWSQIAEAFLKSFDYVITVCDNAKEICSAFTSKVKRRLRIGFDDPAEGSCIGILVDYRIARVYLW